ncbi:MAG: type II toxin-antitoxin system Phd/YefM family antitoxin [Gammaproteobacteria bacterium]|jgi:prevent-host-death family protein|nr:type II toxin-antitoxin system Phd/YefM family antitoxin [Gammaproteobacteria bacterium]
MTSWQLQDAKARFSQVVKSAVTDGPQQITVHGKPAAIVLSADDYARLAGGKPSFVDFVQQSPLRGAPLVVKRARSPARRIRL